MDYKKQIIEMLEKIDNIYWLRSIYVFMKTLIDRIVVRRYSMDYKKEIGNLLNEIQSEKFLKFLYNVIVSFKRQWGY